MRVFFFSVATDVPSMAHTCLAKFGPAPGQAVQTREYAVFDHLATIWRDVVSRS